MILTEPTCICRPCTLGVTPLECCRDLWQRKTRISRLSYDVVYVILGLAFVVELRLVTERQTHDDSI